MTTKDFQTKRPLAIFLSYFRPHRRLFALDIICAFMISLVDLAFPLISRTAMYQWLPQQQYRTFFIVMGIVVLAFVLVVVGAMVFLIGLVRYRTEMQYLNTANRIEALAALAGAGLFPLFTVLRFLHAYTRPGMAVFIVLLAVAVGLWIWRLAVDCKKLQAEKSHPTAEKD